MVKSRFLDKMQDGFAFAFGFFILFGILIGVYAFVEPSQGPSAGSHYLSENSSLVNSPGSWNCTLVSNTVSGSGARTASAICTGDQQLITGGCRSGSAGFGSSATWLDRFGSYPNSNGWSCYAWESDGSTSITAYARCCS